MSLILSEEHSHHPRQSNVDAVGLGKRAGGSSQSPTRTRMIRLVPSKPLPASHRQLTASATTNPFDGYLHQVNTKMQQASDHAYYLSKFADPPIYDEFSEDRLQREFAAKELARLQHHLNNVNYYPTGTTSEGHYYSTANPDIIYPDTALRGYQQAPFNDYRQAPFNNYQQAPGAITTHPRSLAAIRETHGHDCNCKRCRYYKLLSTFPAPYRRELEMRELKRLALKEERKRRRYEMELQRFEMMRAGRMHWDI